MPGVELRENPGFARLEFVSTLTIQLLAARE
jgi:hypothetical protein